jgi:hypothetical protein
VDCYEWIYPEDKNDNAIEEEWRHKEEQKIMQSRKTEATSKQNFETWCAQEGLDTPETVVTIPEEGIEPSTAPLVIPAYAGSMTAHALVGKPADTLEETLATKEYEQLTVSEQSQSEKSQLRSFPAVPRTKDFMTIPRRA